ncbi:MAG: hypothetical protein OHK0013_03360 [Sandaracinaceae bacterium]
MRACPARLDLAALATGLLGCVVAGCAGSPQPEPVEASLEIGTGTARFVPLADGDEVPMVKGAQGGWHLWVSVRAEGLESGLASLELAHQPADESEPEQVMRSGVTFDPPDARGRRVTLGWQAILANPSCSVGRLHRVRVTVTTATGQRLTAEREVMPTGGDNPPPAC